MPAPEMPASAIIPGMILVTGGTGFIGQALIRQLAASGKQVRILIRPSKRSPRLPSGVPVEVAVCSLKDERGLRAAMKGIDTVFHLAGSEGHGGRADLQAVDIEGSQAVSQAAQDAGVGRLFYLSHLGADRASAFPVLKAKAIAENHIRQSGINFTILRTGVVFGPNDHFTTDIAALIHKLPGVFFIPGDGSTLVQPIWVEDLVTAMIWALDNPSTERQLYSVGGPEYLTFRQVVEIVMETANLKRWIVPLPIHVIRQLTIYAEHSSRSFPGTVFWMDYLGADRTTALDTLPRVFGLMPVRLNQRIQYLKGQTWPRRNLRPAAGRTK